MNLLSSSPSPSRPWPGPEAVWAGDPAVVTHPLGDVTSGLLDVGNGASELRLGVDRTMSHLFEGVFEELVPRVDVVGGHVLLRYQTGLLSWWQCLVAGCAPGAWLTLNGRIPWEIHIRGGLSEVVADLSGLTLLGLNIRGGASHVALDLPRPRGTVTLRISGGASHLNLRRPEGVPVLVSVRGGVSALDLDGNHVGAMGGPVRLESPGGAGAVDRYVLEVGGGASHLEVHSVPAARAE